jgi:hypothetical protein
MNLLLVVLFAFTVRASACVSACGIGARTFHAMAPALRLATRAFGIAHIRNVLQVASVLERTTFDEGSAWLPQQL